MSAFQFVAGQVRSENYIQNPSGVWIAQKGATTGEALVQLTGSNGKNANVDGNNNLLVSLGTALSSVTDSIAVGSLSKGPIYTVFKDAIGSGFGASFDGRGYNAVIVSISVTGTNTGAQLTLVGASSLIWDDGSPNYSNVYNTPGTTGLQSTGTNFTTNGIFVFKPLPDRANIYLSRVDGTWTVYAQPVLLGG